MLLSAGDAHEDVWYKQITAFHILCVVVPVVVLILLTVVVVKVKKSRNNHKAEGAKTPVQPDLSPQGSLYLHSTGEDPV